MGIYYGKQNKTYHKQGFLGCLSSKFYIYHTFSHNCPITYLLFGPQLQKMVNSYCYILPQTEKNILYVLWIDHEIAQVIKQWEIVLLKI
jgi:hypothetical protein